MLAFLQIADNILTTAFYIYTFILFYLSFRKCFRRNNENRVVLFVLSLFSNPIICYFISLALTSLVLRTVLPGFIEHVNESLPNIVATLVFSSISLLALTLVFLLLLLMYGMLFGKQARAPMIFLYLMYYNFYLLSMTFDTNTGSVTEGVYIIKLVSLLVMSIVMTFFYRRNVSFFADLIKLRPKADWKIFIIPTALLTFFYTAFAASMTYGIVFGDEVKLIINILFMTLGLLLIWAFYIITKNLNAVIEEEKAKNEVKTLSVEVMEALAHTIDAKDKYTNGHSIRVAKYSRMIAEKMGLPAQQCENIYYMGLLHDIGKIGVPNEIINKSSKLNDEEYDVIKTHPGIGYSILAEIKSRPDLAKGALWHHERYDGKGYPEHKAGDEIPIEARIIAVADSYDAMTSNRSYRRYLPQENVRAEIEANIGTQFDPEAAKYMIAIMDEDTEYVLHE